MIFGHASSWTVTETLSWVENLINTTDQVRAEEMARSGGPELHLEPCFFTPHPTIHRDYFRVRNTTNDEVLSSTHMNDSTNSAPAFYSRFIAPPSRLTIRNNCTVVFRHVAQTSLSTAVVYLGIVPQSYGWKELSCTHTCNANTECMSNLSRTGIYPDSTPPVSWYKVYLYVNTTFTVQRIQRERMCCQSPVVCRMCESLTDRSRHSWEQKARLFVRQGWSFKHGSALIVLDLVLQPKKGQN